METQHEAAVWQQIKQGDPRAIDYLYDAYVQSLYNYGRKITKQEALVKDSIQNLFVDLWRNRESLPSPAKPKLYLLKALRYKIIYQLKREKRTREIELHSQDSWQEYAPSHEFTLIASQHTAEQQQQLRQELLHLSHRQREAITLKFYEGLTNEEIAVAMSIHTQSVYNLIHQSIEILKKSLSVEMTLFVVLPYLLFLL